LWRSRRRSLASGACPCMTARGPSGAGDPSCRSRPAWRAPRWWRGGGGRGVRGGGGGGGGGMCMDAWRRHATPVHVGQRGRRVAPPANSDGHRSLLFALVVGLATMAWKRCVLVFPCAHGRHRRPRGLHSRGRLVRAPTPPPPQQPRATCVDGAQADPLLFHRRPLRGRWSAPPSPSICRAHRVHHRGPPRASTAARTGGCGVVRRRADAATRCRARASTEPVRAPLAGRRPRDARRGGATGVVPTPAGAPLPTARTGVAARVRAVHTGDQADCPACRRGARRRVRQCTGGVAARASGSTSP